MTGAAGHSAGIPPGLDALAAPRAAGDALPARGADGCAQRRLRRLLDSIDQGYCLCEIMHGGDGTPVDYRFLEVNARFEEMTGIVGAVGRTARQVVPDLDAAWVQTFAEAALGNKTLRFERQSQTLGRWFQVLAVPMEARDTFAVLFTDLTAQRTAEKALQDRLRYISELTALLPGVLYAFDLAERRTVWVNDQCSKAIGYRPEEILSRSDLFLPADLHPDDAAGFEQHLAAIASTSGSDVVSTEYRLRHRDGRWRWFAGRHVVLSRDADGRPRQILALAADVTEHKANELALRLSAALDAYRARLSEALRMARDPVEVQAEASRLLGEHLDAARVHYAEIDSTGEFGIVQADYHQPSMPSVVGRHRLDDFGTTVMDGFRAGRPILVRDVASDHRLTDGERAATLAIGVGSYVMLPLTKQDRSVAALVVHFGHPHEWTDGDLALVLETAERTWSAVEQARAEQALRRRQARAELVAELLSALEDERTVAAQVQRLADLLVVDFADYATVEVPDREGFLLGIAARDPDALDTLRTLRSHSRLGPGVLASMSRAAAGESQLIAAVPHGPAAGMAVDPTAAELLRKLGPRSSMAVPIDVGGGVRAALMVGLNDPTRSAYDEEDLAFLAEAAERAGVVLTAARLRQEEHDVAVRLQKALLPDELILDPSLLVEARYVAESDLMEVGGDWYDTYAWPGGQIGVIVGDVVGHNLDSAAAMGRLRAATAALAAHLEPSPAALLGALERFASGPDGTEYATAVCVVVDPLTGRLAYSSAGHPPMLVVAPGCGVERLDAAQAPPLCSVNLGPRPQSVLQLEPDCLVVMYSDGLVERRGEPLDEGLRRLEHAVLDVADEDVTVVADRLVSQMTANSPPEDDVVVACFRYTPVLALLEETVAARHDALGVLRAHMRSWLQRQQVSMQEQFDLLLCVTEACSNAVEHAYRDRDGEIDVQVGHHGRHLAVEIRDHGSWRPVAHQDPQRGRGTSIMRALTRKFSRTTSREGTTVSFMLPLPRDGASGR